MSQPPYGGPPGQGNPYGPDDPYNQQPPAGTPPGWTPAPTGGGGSGYQPINQDPYGQQNPYGQQDPYAQQPDPYAQQNPYNADPYAQQPAYGQPGYGEQGYGQQYGAPAPQKKSQLPWIITAVIAVLGVAAAVLIIVLNKDDEPDPTAGGGSTTATAAAPSSAAEPSVPDPTEPEPTTESEPPPSSSAAGEPASTETLTTQANEMFEYMAEQNKEKVDIYVCSGSQAAFDKEWTDGKWKQFADGKFDVTDATVNDDGETGLVKVGITTASASGTATWPMSYSGKFWYYCPTDQPDVEIINS